jgi:hypothetical protein
MAVFDVERNVIEFFSTTEYGSVMLVEPVCLDRGFGTAILDSKRH